MTQLVIRWEGIDLGFVTALAMKLTLPLFIATAGLFLAVVVTVQTNFKVKKQSFSQPVLTKRNSVVTKSPISSDITSIIDTSLHWEERIQLIRSLPVDSNQALIDRLFEYLEEPPDSNRETWYVVCNEIMEIIRKRNLASNSYTQTLLAFITSTTADPVIRDYAVQHLTQWISGIDSSAQESNPGKVATAFELLHKECLKPENGHLTLVGTTLNSLADATINGTVLSKQQRFTLGELALQIASSPEGSYSVLNQSTALQVAARLNHGSVSDFSRKIAVDPKAPVNLRFSAIAALGQVGGIEDIKLLESFASDETYQFAATAALDRVTSALAHP